MAELSISPQNMSPLWHVSWKINHGYGMVGGFVNLTNTQLELAFGLKDDSDGSTRAVVERTGIPFDAALQGCFVRWGQWLNIPHPGTGMQGDPNISIELDDEIVAAVQALLTTRQ
ncbi:hypothetical protein K2Q00_00980 [Patescibacteria group bacterium]|nr:hypothetical protein [Patescibacteria group bacterium]